MRSLACFLALLAAPAPLLAQNAVHPLDGLATAEYWTVYDVLQSAGQLTPETKFTSVLLRPPEKSAVLAWRPGQPFSREADIVLLRDSQTYTARVDISAKRVVSFEELKGAQSAFLASEMFGADAYIKKDARIVDALRKRGITDLRTVSCSALPVAYRAVPEQATRRLGFGSCSRSHGTYHSWGRSIEGLTFQVDIAAKKIVSIADTDTVPVPTGDQNYEEIPDNPRPYTTPISTFQPMGPGFRIDKGDIFWQNWQFRVRIDPRVGVVLNLVRVVDQGRSRSVLYEASVSELFVPYMDPGNGWNNRAFIDAGEFFAGVGFLKPLRPALDCPAGATWFDGLTVNEDGAPRLTSRLACLFERAPESPAWRHLQGAEIYGRPSRELVLRSAATIGNYDYLLDWRFDPDGTIKVAVGATGVIETKSTTLARVHDDHTMPTTGQLVAEHVMGINHDHYFSYRLDFDVDGAANSFMLNRLVPQRLTNDPMRKSIWVNQPVVAQREKEAILDIRLDQPSMWMFMNPSVKGPLNYPVAYEVMPGATAKSIMAADDPAQRIGAFSEHQFWVTPYNVSERYAAGTYPTSSDANDGLAVWTQANRSIANTDIVGWYTLGFHHITRAEDWPVMPTMWHEFLIRPFHFFQRNPVLDLPKSLGDGGRE
jgi:primary-amine oxidase